VIYTHEHVRGDMTLTADLCVIGSGAGGSPVADAVAAAGKRVVVLESGSFLTARDFSQLEHEMFPRLYEESGARTTIDGAVHVHQGKGVGGSTLHNLNLCKRLPAQVLTRWREQHGLSELTPERLDALYSWVEREISVSKVAPENLNSGSSALMRGCEALGWSGGTLQHNRLGCTGSGFCEIGCPFDAKQNALKVFIARAVQAGAMVLADTTALSIEMEGRTARRVVAETRDPQSGALQGSITVEAAAVCVSASATGTPALLLRSHVPDPHELIGSQLHLHPGAAVAGVFHDPQRGWSGVPQGYECTELLDFDDPDRRIWIVPAFAHPIGVSSILGASGAAHAAIMADYSRMTALSPVLHDDTSGTVRPKGRTGVAIDYWLEESDRDQLRRGLKACARLLFAAGAERVLVPLPTTLVLDHSSEIEAALSSIQIDRHVLDLTAVHPMSSVWMGDDPRSSCVTSGGRYHHLDNLFVADTSLYPSSIGVPPQLTAYALGRHVGEALVEFLG